MEPKILTEALKRPDRLAEFGLREWDCLIQKGRRAAVLARLEFLLSQRNLVSALPPQPKAHLESARLVAANEQRILSWEIKCVREALRDCGSPIVFLKGAAYLLAKLPNFHGRISTDLDILVEKEALPHVEAALIKHGWEHIKLEDYDQYYYRKWTHELPPLRHRDRRTIVDVHHTILPLTGRLHPDPRKLLTASIELENGTKVLAPVDMLLHVAAHMFQDGELMQPMRELVDLDQLLRHFMKQSDFWNRLFERAKDLGLGQPLFYALRYTHKYLETPVPESGTHWSEAQNFGRLRLRAMDNLVESVIEPFVDGWEFRRERIAKALLRLRAHWLRMPPWLLIYHLSHKQITSWKHSWTLDNA